MAQCMEWYVLRPIFRSTSSLFACCPWQEPVPVKSTLIVMPANLLEQWQTEVDTHVTAGALTWYFAIDPGLGPAHLHR